jgi:hypothetical protein
MSLWDGFSRWHRFGLLGWHSVSGFYEKGALMLPTSELREVTEYMKSIIR